MKVEVIGKRVVSSGTDDLLPVIARRSGQQRAVSAGLNFEASSLLDCELKLQPPMGPSLMPTGLDVIADDNCAKFTRYCEPLYAAHGKLVYLKYSAREPFNILQR